MSTYLRHCVLVRLLLWVCPIYDNITVPNLHSSRLKSSLSQASGLVRLVLQETKSPVSINKKKQMKSITDNNNNINYKLALSAFLPKPFPMNPMIDMLLK